MNVGILGGGQLARMLILAGKPLGLDFVVYTNHINDTTKNLAEHVVGELNDQLALLQFASQVDVITFETENIPQSTIEFVEQTKPVYPSKEAMYYAQDRLLEKNLFVELGIPTNEFVTIDSNENLQKAAEVLGFPFVVKARRFGYDGKHQYVIFDQASVFQLMEKNLTNCLAEAFVSFEREVSVIGVRDQKGKTLVYDLAENKHLDGILDCTHNRKDDSLLKSASDYLSRIMVKTNYVGVLAIEFFVKDNQLIANEMAPRVHNSGHWTIDACVCSQFENHVRAICGFALGNTRSVALCKMSNIIGEWPSRDVLLNTNYTAIHDYQKTPRINRKLGHVTELFLK